MRPNRLRNFLRKWIRALVRIRLGLCFLLLAFSLPRLDVCQGAAVPPEWDPTRLLALGDGLTDVDVGPGEAEMDIAQP